MAYQFGGLTLANVGDIVTQTSVSTNFQKLAENSAGATQPAPAGVDGPRTGQLWFDTTAGAGLGVMKINIGTPAVPDFVELSGGGGGLVYVLKTANYTTVAGEGVLTDTSGGAFTVTLPATPTLGDQVVVADAGNAWGTNNLTVGRNGSTIGGLAENLVCDITGASVQLVYDGTTWEAYAQIGGAGGNAVTLDGVQTLTNKTIRQMTQIISTNTSAVASNIYILIASLTLTLPASPIAGDWVGFSNRSATLTPVIDRNGENIMGLASNMTLDNVNASGTLVYTDAIRGWVFVD